MKQMLVLLTLFLFTAGTLLAQKTITGKVTDEKGDPIPSASVTVVGTGTGTTTSEDGTYSLSVPSTAKQLTFSSVDFEDITINIGSAAIINAVLKNKSEELTDVVVTGYTRVDKKRFAGATVSANAAEVRKQPMASFDQALQGAGAGISVIANSGQPGRNGIVRIRGNGSLNGDNVPLYILDGIEITAADFAALNQGDFETIDILKDAVSSGQYGSRGANGVIVITTKKGKVGKLALNYDAQLGFSDLPKDKLIMMNAAQKVEYERNALQGPAYPWTDAQYDSLAKIDFSWKDALMQRGMTQQHQISISGGSATSRIYGSLSYLDQEGIVKTTGLKRYTARVNIDNTHNNWRFGIGLQGGYAKYSQTNEGDAVTNSPLNGIRWINPYMTDKNPATGAWTQWNTTSRRGLIQVGNSWQPNVAMDLLLNYNWTMQIKAVATSYLEYHFDFLKGLYARTNWGIDYGQDETATFTSPLTSAGAARDGGLNRGLARNFRYTGTTSINYRKTLLGNHDIDAGIFFEVVKNDARSFGFTGYGFTNGFTNETGITPGSGSQVNYIPAVTGTGTQNGIQSFFGIVNYAYARKYTVSLVGRRDGSSRFGVDNRFANFGSVGLGWVISEEDFLKQYSFIDNLRIRASYGTNGNNGTALGNFGHIPQFTRSTYAGSNGWSPTIPGNLIYRWETNKTLNFGLDFAVLKNRLSGSIDVYNRQTVNLFYQQPVDLSSGFTQVGGNDGTLRNRGIELTLNSDIIRTKDFVWSIGGNITYNQNRIIAIPNDSVPSDLTILAKGHPASSFYLVDYVGVNPDNGRALYRKLDGSITEEFSSNDRQIWGTSVAPWFGGINTGITYRGIDLTANFVFFLGRKMYNNDRVNAVNPTYWTDNMSVEALREWRKPGDITDVPTPIEDDVYYFEPGITRFLEDASYWRLRNITLGYTVPASVLGKTKLRSARLFIQGQNWWTKTKFQSFDPEFAGGSLIGAQYPALVQTTIGLSIGF